MELLRLEYNAHCAQTASSVASCSIPDIAFFKGGVLGSRTENLEVVVLTS